MATLEQMYQALRAADKAGAADDAKRIAGMIRDMQAPESNFAERAAQMSPIDLGVARAKNDAFGNYLREQAMQTKQGETPEQKQQRLYGNIHPKYDISTGEGMVRAGIQGGSFGTADEATAAIASMIGDGTYQQYLDRERAKLKQFREEQPVAAYGAEIAGSIPTSLLPVLNIARGGKLAQAAGTGALQGAIYGAGSADGDATDRFIGAGTGGIMGGSIGAATVPIAKGVQNLAQHLAKKSAAKELGISEVARAEIQRGMRADDSLTGIGANRIRAGGPDAMVADAGPATLSTLDEAMSEGGRALSTGRHAIDQRVKRASGKLASLLDDTMGEPQGLRMSAQDISRQTRGARDAAYTEAYNTPIDYASRSGRAIEDTLKKIDDDTIKAAVKEANAQMLADGTPNMQIKISVADDGSVTLSEMMNVQQLDQIKRALSTLAYERHVDDLGRLTGTGNRLQGLSRELRNALGEAVPSYKDAVKIGGDKIERDQALMLGKKILRPSTTMEDVKLAASDMSDAAKEQAKIGLRGHLDETLAQVKAVASDPDVESREAQKLVKDLSSRANREKISLILGGDVAEGFFKQFDEAMQAFSVRAGLNVNSKTAARTASREAKEAAANEQLFAALRQGRPLDEVRNIAAKLFGRSAEQKQAIRDAINADVVRVLTGPRGEDAIRMLRTIAMQEPRIAAKTQKAGRLASQLMKPAPAMATGQLAQRLQE